MKGSTASVCLRSYIITLFGAFAWLLLTIEGTSLPLGSSQDWLTLKTEHFEIIFPPEMITSAREAAPIAEQAYQFWAQKLQHSPPEKTYIILLDRSDVTSVSMSIFPQNVIVIDHPFGWSSKLWSSPDRSWVEYYIFTEYGRIADQTRVEGIAADLRALLGRLVAPGALKPLWLREGLHTPTLVDSSFAEMAIRTLVESNRFPTLAQLSSSYEKRTWPPATIQAQAVGWVFLQYLDETYGDDVVSMISRAYAANPLTSVASSALTLATGQAPEAIYQDFQAWAMGRFTRAEQQIEAQNGVTPRTLLSSLSFLSESPVWSPAGDAIVYRHSDPQRLSELRSVRPDGANDHALLQCECGPPIWLDETTLIYPRLGHTNGSLLYDLYRYDVENRREERLTYGERIYAVEPFPDGHRLLVARTEKEGKNSLVVFDLTERSREILKEFDADQRVHSMAVSPDGRLIALSLWVSGQAQDIYWMSREGGELIPLTRDPALDFDPVFSADGNFVLFSSNRDGIFDLYVLRLGDRQLLRATRSLTGSFNPALSPDGQRIVFVGYDREGFSLYSAEYAPDQWGAIQPSAGASSSTSLEQPVAESSRSVQPLPYDPGSTLVPTFWLPLVGFNHVGLFTRNEDPLGRHRYSLSAGLSWAPLTYFYELDYANTQILPIFHIRFQGSPPKERQEFSLEFPLQGSLNHERAFTLGLGQERGLTEFFFNGKLLDLRGFDLFLRRSSLTVEASLGWLAGEPTRRLALDWGEQLQLPVESLSGPHQVAFRAGAAWGDGAAFRLGGVTGRYPLRGFENVTLGSELVSTTLEYRFPVWAVEWGCCGASVWPLFVHELRGSLFLDAGVAGTTLETDQIRVAFGLELQLQLVLGYSLAEARLRFGFAYGVGTEPPQVYFALGPSF